MVPNELTLTVTQTSDDERRVSVAGEMDMAASPSLGAMIDGFVADGVRRVVLDLSGVPFADSSGLRVIIAAGDRLAGVDGSLSIDSLSPAVERLLEMTGLLDRYRAG